MPTNVIARKVLQTFWKQYPEAEKPISTWYQIVSKGEWNTPAELKETFGNNVDFVGDNRAIFDIGGNKYRVIVHFAYRRRFALIKFVVTHAEYDKVSAEKVS